jgi:hypothetical protein
MDNIICLVAKYADTDTRRAMGFPPRKLSSEWKDFNPHPFGQEIFRYFVSTKTLLYYEFWKYGQFYSEITEGIVPKSRTRHKWRHLPGCIVYGIHCDESIYKTYRSERYTNFNTVYTAGWPIFILN